LLGCCYCESRGVADGKKKSGAASAWAVDSAIQCVDNNSGKLSRGRDGELVKGEVVGNATWGLCVGGGAGSEMKGWRVFRAD
jgi:hypothetical protein